MTNILCQICLRTGFTSTGPLGKRLKFFYDELCDYDIFLNSEYQFCSNCKYELGKFYNFRQRCQRAHDILKTCRLYKGGIVSLHAQMPPNNNLAFSALGNQKLYSYNFDLTSYVLYNLDTTTLQTIEIPTSTAITSHAITSDAITADTITADIIPSDAITSGAITSNAITSDAITSDATPCFVINEATNAIDGTSYTINETSNVIDNTSYVLKPTYIADASNDTYSVMHCEVLNEISEIRNPISLPQTNTDEGNIQNDKEDDESELTLHELKKGVRKRSNKQKPKKVNKTRNEKYLNTKKSDSVSENDVVCVDELQNKTQKLSADDKEAHKKILEFQERVSWLLDNEKIDLGEDIDLDKEMFLLMFEKCDKTLVTKRGVFKKGPGAKLKKFLLFLLKRYNPEYESVFEIEYLTTQQMKIAEFEARRKTNEYIHAEYKCDKCYKVFEVPKTLDYHNKFHDPSRPQGCDICGMRFTANKHLVVHQRSNHYSVYRCKLCPIVTYIFSKSTMYTHLLSHAEIACAHCARRFVSSIGLKNHMKLKHPEIPFSLETVSCEKCNIEFESRDQLQKHTATVHQRMHNYKCLYIGCAERFVSSAELRAHAVASGHVKCRKPKRRALHGALAGAAAESQATGAGGEAMEAEGDAAGAEGEATVVGGEAMEVEGAVAGAGAGSEAMMVGGEAMEVKGDAAGALAGPSVRGEAMEAGVEAMEAEGDAVGVGGETARKQRTPKKPREAVMGPDKPYRTCPVCQEQVQNKHGSSLYKHHIAKHPSLPYSYIVVTGDICEHCGKSYTPRSVYLDHLNTHSGEKPYECSDCGARFHMRRSLDEHCDLHARYECKVCEKMFRSASVLFYHRQRHTGECRFKCEICSKGFLDSSRLKKHVKFVHLQIPRNMKTKGNH